MRVRYMNGWWIWVFILLLLGVGLGCQLIGSGVFSSSAVVDDGEAIFFADYGSIYLMRGGQQGFAAREFALPAAVLAQPHYIVYPHIHSENDLSVTVGEHAVISHVSYRVAYATAEGLFTHHITGADPATISPTGQYPRWSPDGERLVFEQDGALWISGAAGENQQMLTDGTQIEPLSWSPDGTQILYWVGSSLAVITADGQNPRTLVADRNRLALDPQWAADNQTIVAGYTRAEGTKLVRINAADGQMEDFVVWDKPSGIVSFSPSPDDNRVAFVAEGCQDERNDFGFRFEKCDYMAYMADENGQNSRRLGDATLTMNNERNRTPGVVRIQWAAQRPGVTFPPPSADSTEPSVFEQAQEGIESAQPSDVNRSDLYAGIFYPVPFETAVHTESWTVQFLEQRSGEAVKAEIERLDTSPNIRANADHYAIKARLTYRGTDSGQLYPHMLYPFNGWIHINTDNSNWTNPQIFLDDALRKEISSGEAVEGWIYVSFPQTAAPDQRVILVRPEEEVGTLRSRFVRIQTE